MTKPSEAVNSEARRLISQSETEFHFGRVIASPGRKLGHEYRLKNGTNRDVSFVEVVNRKTCCGEVRSSTLVLRPGETGIVEVTLTVGDKFGLVTHETEVVTDLPDDSSIVLTTMAEAIPPLRVEAETANTLTLAAGTQEAKRIEFRALAAGTASEAPLDLDRLSLLSTLKVEWTGPKLVDSGQDAGSIESRPFVVWVTPAAIPGKRRAEVLIWDGDRIMERLPIDWDVAPPLVAAPGLIALGPGQKEFHLVITSTERTSFRITGIESRPPGMTGSVQEDRPAVRHRVKLQGRPKLPQGRGVVTVVTDLSTQEMLDVPLIVID